VKSKKLFLLILFLIIFLILWCLFFYKRDSFYFYKEDINSTYNGVSYETIPVKKTVPEAEKEINLLLVQKPIKFLNNSFILESNETMDNIISILDVTIGDVIIKVSSYSDINGSRSFNRKLTQKRADTIASYIKDRYKPRLINSIGYGKEFPLPKDSNRTNDRIEIHLKRIYND